MRIWRLRRRRPDLWRRLEAAADELLREAGPDPDYPCYAELELQRRGRFGRDAALPISWTSVSPNRRWEVDAWIAWQEALLRVSWLREAVVQAKMPEPMQRAALMWLAEVPRTEMSQRLACSPRWVTRLLRDAFQRCRKLTRPANDYEVDPDILWCWWQDVSRRGYRAPGRAKPVVRGERIDEE